jgi:dolichol-phosphate mannosyltransferase
MYKGRRIVVMCSALNEETKVGEAIRRVPRDVADLIVCMDDGSTDNTANVARAAGAHVISMGKVVGVGATIRAGLEYVRAQKEYDIIVWMAGNNKDDPSEIPLLLDPICDEGYDFVQGSRYLKGGGFGGDMPFYRKIATKLHPLMMSFFLRKSLTESTNGFRAVRLNLFDDPRMNLNQKWLDEYELEVYMLFKTIRLGYKHTEVPCTKIYPPKKLGITKMKPIIGWWSILRPVFLLGLGLKK